MIEKSPRVFGDFLGVCTPFAQTICIEKSVKMKPFMDKDFLLDTPTARHLYHDYCEALPICDYHCHLSPKEIYENAQPTDISALWLSGDHYKWRAMRSCGVDERYCTGDASPREKFQKFAYTLQYAIGNPLYHWAHIELQMYFGIDTPLSAATADDIYDRANGVIAAGDFRPRTLIEKSKVKVLCTTDDPADDLAYHKKIAALPDFDCKVLPTFRPDKALNIQAPDFADYMGALAAAAGMEIHTVDDVIAALRSRAEYFHSVGCRVSDQAFDVPPYAPAAPEQVQAVFAKALAGAPVTEQEAQIYKTPVLLALGKLYHELHWTMEVHIGAMRNNNSRMFRALGPDTGFDSVDDGRVARPLSRLLDAMDSTDSLPKTILFYNSGAYLTCAGSDSLEDLKFMEAQGVEIRTCGTCLDFYKLKETLAVGSITNMYALSLIHI